MPLITDPPVTFVATPPLLLAERLVRISNVPLPTDIFLYNVLIGSGVRVADSLGVEIYNAIAATSTIQFKTLASGLCNYRIRKAGCVAINDTLLVGQSGGSAYVSQVLDQTS